MPATAPGPSESGSAPAAGESPAARALIVDDERNLRAMLVELLTGAGFKCLEARDAEEALALVERENPELAILDLALPGMSGAELAWRIREKIPGLPLVALSGKLKVWDPDDLKDLGFTRIFAKPMDCDEFLRACRRIVAGEEPGGASTGTATGSDETRP
ncbi:MAG: response regulator, partial [Planctomycetota bacterium]